MTVRVLELIAPSVSNETLGKVAAELVAAGVMEADEFGRRIRSLLDVPAEAVDAAVDAAATKSNELPTSPVAQSALLQTIYESFGTYRRRSVNALCRATGLTPAAVLQLVEGNADFRVSNGRETGRQFVSLRSL